MPGKVSLPGTTISLLEALILAGSPTTSAANEVIVIHPPKPGDTWRMNFYAMKNNGGVAFSPILGQGNFHKASRFGRVTWITPDMRAIIQAAHLCFAATVTPDGRPNLSPKGTTEVWDDDYLIFVDIKSPGTVANLRQNPAIEINVVDQLVRKGYRFKGTAEVFADGPVFEKALALRRERGAKNPMRGVVLISVERALPLISPGYDLGLREDEMRAIYRRHFEVLWSAGEDLATTPE